jgi:hypothetical protein
MTPFEESTGRKTALRILEGEQKCQTRKLRKTSRGHAGGSHFTVEFSRDEPGPEDLRLALSRAGLHIASQEGMKML